MLASGLTSRLAPWRVAQARPAPDPEAGLWMHTRGLIPRRAAERLPRGGQAVASGDGEAVADAARLAARLAPTAGLRALLVADEGLAPLLAGLAELALRRSFPRETRADARAALAALLGAVQLRPTVASALPLPRLLARLRAAARARAAGNAGEPAEEEEERREQEALGAITMDAMDGVGRGEGLAARGDAAEVAAALAALVGDAAAAVGGFGSALAEGGEGEGAPPPPPFPSRTKWTRLVLHPVLIGHAVSHPSEARWMLLGDSAAAAIGPRPLGLRALRAPPPPSRTKWTRLVHPPRTNWTRLAPASSPRAVPRS